MSLRLIYGRAGTGKTEFCFKDIKNKENKQTKIYIITPEQFSFTAEQKLLEILEKDSVINAEVISFNRMANRIFTEVYGACNTNLSPVGKSMLLYSILQNEKSKLNFLGNSDETIDVLDRTIKDFKKHNVTTDILENTISKIDNKYVNAKLTDLSLIYKSYENQIKDNYIDEDDTLTILANLIDKSSMFNNSIVYIDEFAGFTPQEYEIIKKLLKITQQVNITLCIDKLEEAVTPDIDIFYSNKVTANRLIDCAKKENVKIEEPIILNKNYRFLNEELAHLEQNIYSVSYKRFNDDCRNINLYLAQNLYDEIEYVAQNIIDLVRNNQYKYNDISVISKNIDTYASLVKAIFDKYNIPVFIDEPKDLSQNVLIKYILAIFDVFTNNWSCESVFNYIKTGLCDIEKEDIYYLENYCTKWGIKGRKWYESKFENVEDDEELQRLNKLRENVITPLLDFKNSLDKKHEVQQICNEIYELLVKNNIQEKIQKKVSNLEKIGQVEIARQYENSVKLVLEVLDEMVMIFKDKKVTINQFKNILKLGFSNSSLKDIPTMLDQVVVGSVDRSRSHKVKAIFIIGLNDGVFPSVNKDEGFLNDDDRVFLEEQRSRTCKRNYSKVI